ncbi:hypothetical protein, partial [Variovorax sp. YR634]|uniref:hypothetical protein n=1 Tax=Variovorax sp. YR634 TaxID=1884385 RepID=UPI001C40ACEA
MGTIALFVFWGRVSARRPTHFLLLRQKKVRAISNPKCNDGLNVDILVEAVLEEDLSRCAEA